MLKLFYVIGSPIFIILLCQQPLKVRALDDDSVKSRIDIKAQFFNCKLDDEVIDGKSGRYHRERLLKYDAIQEWSKKISLTMNITANYNDIGEEYIPIEHAFYNGKRARLLDPYVIRMKRSLPLQAYPLKYIGDVRAILSYIKDDYMILMNQKNSLWIRKRRELGAEMIKNINTVKHTNMLKTEPSQSVDINRYKRHVYNVIVEDTTPTLNTEIIVDFFNKDTNDLSLLTNKYFNNENNGGYNDRLRDDKMYDNMIGLQDHNKEYMYRLYEINSVPELWHTLNLSLLQKSMDENGDTVWNDVTSDDNVTVGTNNNKWTRNDYTVSYRPDLINKDVHVFPPGLCLLRKMDDDFMIDSDTVDNIIIIPSKQMIKLKGKREKRENLIINYTGEHDRVLIRMERAYKAIDKRSIKIIELCKNLFVTTTHTYPVKAQIDIEARADNNQLVRVGSSGRISTIIVDSTNRKRTILTVHAGNTGLAAAHFRVSIRDCEREMMTEIGNKEGIITEMTLIPPGHTKKIQLNIPIELPINNIHCLVALENKDEESVVVRDVSIKKLDRCFCVWYCDCVCLGDDPNLLCSKMPHTKLSSAGISHQDRPRPNRCYVYRDTPCINWAVVIIGVLTILLFLGFTKACIGIPFRRVGIWGIDRLIKFPRHMEHYHEPWLRMRRVIYDGQGWPLHPDTKQRTVLVLSLPCEFLLNLIFFIILPCLILKDFISTICKHTSRKKENALQADEEIKNLKGPKIQQETNKNTGTSFFRRKKKDKKNVLHGDSDNEDTTYVKAQMERSKVSLARNE